MSTFFNNEQLEAARSLAEEIRKEIDPNLSVTENMIRSLQMRTVDLDAETVVRDLNTGIRNFHEVYEDANAQGLEVMITRNVEKLLENMNEEQQRELLMGILRDCANATGSTVPENMDLETMKQTACTYISEYSLAFAGSEAFRKMAELDEQTVAAITEASASAQEEGYVALALYLLNTSGKMEETADNMTAEQIGAMTAATLAAHRAVEEAAEAEVENETEEQTAARYGMLKKVLKIIGGALTITLILGAAAASMVMPVALIAAGLDCLLFYPTFAEFVVNGVAVVVGLAGLTFSFGYGVHNIVRVANRSGITAGIVAVYQKTAEFVADVLIPGAKHFWEILRETVRQKTAQYNTAEVTANVDETPEVEIYDEINEVTEEIEEEEAEIF